MNTIKQSIKKKIKDLKVTDDQAKAMVEKLEKDKHINWRIQCVDEMERLVNLNKKYTRSELNFMVNMDLLSMLYEIKQKQDA